MPSNERQDSGHRPVQALTGPWPIAGEAKIAQHLEEKILVTAQSRPSPLEWNRA